MGEIRKIELLAPARDAEIAIEAIKHGADAVYMGATSHGARAMAGNSLEDIRRVVDFAHRFDAKVYVTVNTLVYDDEIAAVERLVKDLYDAGADALIVQDMGLLRMDLPPIELHASTQCDIRTPEKAAFLERVGFSQLVLARELSLNEIRDIRMATSVPLEGFVHGALCVSYSGRCRISEALHHRSANRGECAQVCRYTFDLEDESGRVIVRNKHLLSLRDMNRSARLVQMIDAGISSFKIEGRLKDAGYVKNVVAYYRDWLDGIIAGRDDLTRSSLGKSEYSFRPVIAKSFNRGFTEYFLTERRPANGERMASANTPKSQGEFMGSVTGTDGSLVMTDATGEFHNGDGLMFVAPDGTISGARVNEAYGNNLVLRNTMPLQKGSKIFRNYDKQFEDALSRDTADRRLCVDMRLEYAEGRLSLTATDERGERARVVVELKESLQPARTEQKKRQEEELAKLGNTCFRLRSCEVEGRYFIPMSVLSQLRRDVACALEELHKTHYVRGKRREEDRAAQYPAQVLESADNVANHLAREFYASHGVKRAEDAIEVAGDKDLSGEALMHTRYCLRRELGMCLKEKNCSYRGRLYLRADKRRFVVETDCAACEMRIKLAD